MLPDCSKLMIFCCFFLPATLTGKARLGSNDVSVWHKAAIL
jgi:hypothetical protein